MTCNGFGLITYKPPPWSVPTNQSLKLYNYFHQNPFLISFKNGKLTISFS